MSENYTDKLFHNRYRLIEKKGRGSFAEVWLARDTELDLDVAIKIYIALDDNGVNDFKEEFRTSWAMNHPNLLHAYYYEIDNNCPFLVMPYCPVKSESLIGTADEKEVWKFIRDVSAGLAYIHEMDVVHNDIKPDNILRNAAGTYMVTDFGISKKMRSTLRKNSIRQMTDSKEIGGGSPSYMAPELFSATPDAVKATDIWALGVTLYEIVTGDLPFFGQGGGMLLHGAELPKIDADISKELKDLITACLQKDPWDRPTAQQLYETAIANLEGRAVQLSKRASKKSVSKEAKVTKKRQYGEMRAVFNWRENIPTIYIWIITIGSLLLAVFSTYKAYNSWHHDYDALDMDEMYSVIAMSKDAKMISYSLTGRGLADEIAEMDKAYGRNSWIIEPRTEHKQPRHTNMMFFAFAALMGILMFVGGLMLLNKSKVGFWVTASVQTLGTVCLFILLWTTSLSFGKAWLIRLLMLFLLAVGIPLLYKILTLERADTSYWQQMNYKISPFIVVVSCSLIAVALFFSFYDCVRAIENLDEYNSLVKECTQIIDKELGDGQSKKDEAISLLWNIAKFEDRYGNVNSHYRGDYASLNSQREVKLNELKELAKQWAEAADAQVRIGRIENISKAVEFYNTSLLLYEDREVRAKLKESEANEAAYMKPIAIELCGEGEWNETLYASKIKYLHARLKYEGLDHMNSHSVRLIVKIYNNGDLKYNSNLYSSSYTFYRDIDVMPGNSSKYIELSGWGQDKAGVAYSKGSLRVEIWCGDKELITKETRIY